MCRDIYEYMGSVLSGSEILKGARELDRQLIGIFEKGGMSQHKWRCNDKTLVQIKEENYIFLNLMEIKELDIV